MSASRLLILALGCAMALGSCSGGEDDDGGGEGGTGGVILTGGTAGNIRSPDAACATLAVAADLTPVNLIMMYDKSGSMGDPNNDFDPAERWNPVSDGMLEFLADPGTTGLQASLKFFPVLGNVEMACRTLAYETPDVPLQPLTSTQDFIDAIANTSPNGGTPTLPALQGAINYATSLYEDIAHTGEVTVVVLITDGEPGFAIDGVVQPGCDNNNVAAVADVARAAYEGPHQIPTYVIGIGPSLDSLNQIAAAGGTLQATMVALYDPEVTKEQFKDELMRIREKHISCNMRVPAASEGEVLDFERVNVDYFVGDTRDEEFNYSEDCADPTGWQYDDIDEPTRILLCNDTCAYVRVDTLGEVRIELGCRTRGLPE